MPSFSTAFRPSPSRSKACLLPPRGAALMTLMSLLMSLLLSLLSACASTPELAERLATSDRALQDKARDAGRRPAEVLAFLGIEPGMTVIDMIASGGYYSEVLAEAVGPDGLVYAQNIEFVLKMRDGANEKAISARLANGRLPNVKRLDAEFTDLGLDAGSVDAVFTALNMHDIIDGRGPQAAAQVLAAVHEVLAPGGLLGIIDHAGDPGKDALNKELHRIDEARVAAAVEAAGFKIEARSGVLRNVDDDRTTSVFAPEIRGRTDRFVLRVRKPN